MPNLGYYEKQRACKECHMSSTGNLTPRPELLEPRSCISVKPFILNWLAMKLQWAVFRALELESPALHCMI
jgi:hypothetical protein